MENLKGLVFKTNAWATNKDTHKTIKVKLYDDVENQKYVGIDKDGNKLSSEDYTFSNEIDEKGKAIVPFWEKYKTPIIITGVVAVLITSVIIIRKYNKNK